MIYSFRFSVERSGPSMARNTHIALRRENGCWKIDDIIHDGVSLRSVVQASG